MKITDDHYRQLSALITDVLDRVGPDKLADHYQQRVLGDSRTRDPWKRFRWDVLFAIPQPDRFPLLTDLYAYLEDSHIDTALRSLIPNPAPRLRPTPATH